jgi:hypothetical protein
MQCSHSELAKRRGFQNYFFFILRDAANSGKYITAITPPDASPANGRDGDRLPPNPKSHLFFFVHVSCDFFSFRASRNRTTGPDVPSLAT